MHSQHRGDAFAHDPEVSALFFVTGILVSGIWDLGFGDPSTRPHRLDDYRYPVRATWATCLTTCFATPAWANLSTSLALLSSTPSSYQNAQQHVYLSLLDPDQAALQVTAIGHVSDKITQNLFVTTVHPPRQTLRAGPLIIDLPT